MLATSGSTLRLKPIFDDLEENNFTAYDYATDKTVDKDHGRIEVHTVWTLSDPQLIQALRGTQR